MFKKVLIAIVIVLVAILSFAATKPSTFRVQRTTSIAAPPEKLFAIINDFHNWGSWSPWEKLDPAMKRTYGGTASGVGAVYEWTGNDKVGQGRMEITESTPSSKVTIKLDFLKPFEAHDMAEFTLEPTGSSTSVTWAMYGPTQYMAKVISVFVSMDKMVGKDFETGLANLNSLATR